MYNETLKHQYISEVEYRNTNLRYYLTCQFGKSEAFEIRYGKDLCNFTVEEIIDYYKSLCLTSFETLMVLNSQLKIYTNYCINRSLVTDNQNHYNEIVYEIVKDCINTGLAFERIVTREDLLHIIKDLINPSDKFLVLALFEGICGQKMCEFANLTTHNFKNGKVELISGRVLSVSDELVNLAYESEDEYNYYTYSINGDIRSLPYNPKDTSILKTMYNASPDGDLRQRLYNKLMRCKKNAGAECLTITSLMESGRIEMVRKVAKEEDISFKEALIKHKEIEDIYGKVYSYSTYMLKYGEIIEGM